LEEKVQLIQDNKVMHNFRQLKS